MFFLDLDFVNFPRFGLYPLKCGSNTSFCQNKSYTIYFTKKKIGTIDGEARIAIKEHNRSCYWCAVSMGSVGGETPNKVFAIPKTQT